MKPKKLLEEYPWRVGHYCVEPCPITGRDQVQRVTALDKNGDVLDSIPVYEERTNNDPAPLIPLYVSTNC